MRRLFRGTSSAVQNDSGNPSESVTLTPLYLPFIDADMQTTHQLCFWVYRNEFNCMRGWTHKQRTYASTTTTETVFVIVAVGTPKDDAKCSFLHHIFYSASDMRHDVSFLGRIFAHVCVCRKPYYRNEVQISRELRHCDHSTR